MGTLSGKIPECFCRRKYCPHSDESAEEMSGGRSPRLDLHDSSLQFRRGGFDVATVFGAELDAGGQAGALDA